MPIARAPERLGLPFVSHVHLGPDARHRRSRHKQRQSRQINGGRPLSSPPTKRPCRRSIHWLNAYPGGPAAASREHADRDPGRAREAGGTRFSSEAIARVEAVDPALLGAAHDHDVEPGDGRRDCRASACRGGGWSLDRFATLTLVELVAAFFFVLCRLAPVHRGQPRAESRPPSAPPGDGRAGPAGLHDPRPAPARGAYAAAAPRRARPARCGRATVSTSS